MELDRKVVPAEAFLTFDPPPARQPQPIEPTAHVRGRRVVLIHVDGYVYDHRAMSDPRQGPIDGITDHSDDRWFVAVASEFEYYRWGVTGEKPAVEWWPTHARGSAHAPMIYIE
jgi:hypothetical protein